MVNNSFPKLRSSKRNFLLMIGSFIFFPNRWVFAQKFSPVQTLQSQFVEYQPASLKKLPVDTQAIHLDIPPLADSGNSIPFTIKIKAPSNRLVQSFEIIAPENPFPMVLRVKLPQAKNDFQLSTRIRLALSQDVWVIVSLDNGDKIANSVPSVVTLNACFDAT